MPLTLFENTSSETKCTWIYNALSSLQSFKFDSIEGITISYKQGVLMLMHRAKILYSEVSLLKEDEIISAIKYFEGDSLIRKINLASKIGIDFKYLLYSENEQHHVWIISFRSINEANVERQFDSFSAFGKWLDDFRHLDIKKGFGHNDVTDYKTSSFDDLPNFDQTLRNNRTPWLANLDGFISDEKNDPILLIELQTANRIPPKSHSNNEFFLKGADLNRFHPIAIASVQANIPWAFIVYSSDSRKGFRIKLVNQLTCPYSSFDESSGAPVVDAKYKELLKKSVRNRDAERIISTKYSSFTFAQIQETFELIKNQPPLSIESLSYPHIHYKFNKYWRNYKDFSDAFMSVLNTMPR